MDTPTFLYNESIKEFNRNLENNYSKYYETCLQPIKVICNIPVYTKIKFIKYNNNSGYKYILLIETNNILQSYDDEDLDLEKYVLYLHSIEKNEFNTSTILDFLFEIQTIFRNLEFNKLLGIFTLKGKVKSEYVGFDIFGDEFISSQECCVCMDKTTIFTDCHHPLCIECWSYLKNNLCPICRNNNITIADPNYVYRNHSAIQSRNQTINESNDQLITQPLFETENQSTDRSEHQSADRSEHQSEDRSEHRSEHQIEYETEHESDNNYITMDEC